MTDETHEVNSDEPLTGEAPAKRPAGRPLVDRVLRRFSVRGLLLTLVVLFIALTATTIVYTSVSTDSCQVCHAKEVSKWKKSTHKRAQCYACHGESGTFSGAVNSMDRLRELLLTMTGKYRIPILSDVRNASCMSCHEDLIKGGKLPDTSVRVSHKEIVQGGLDCVQCHSAVAHGSAVPLATTPQMETCLKCHDGLKAGNGCSICHPGGAKPNRNDDRIWKVTHGAQWKTAHGMGDLASCRTCHPEKSCSRCHGMVMPHPTDWKALHGRTAKRSLKPCASCHLGGYCRSCHGMAMPHPANWLPLHSRSADTIGEKTCLRCHVQDDCFACHEEHVHPGGAKGATK